MTSPWAGINLDKARNLTASNRIAIAGHWLTILERSYFDGSVTGIAEVVADRPFDAVLVHSFSRFFRDSFKFEMHRRSLEKNNVALVSLTQTVSEDIRTENSRRDWCIRF
jgi:hypothetical protein